MDTRRLLRWSLGSSLAFIVLLSLLHLIKPELDPSWNFISEYQVGKFGWIMQLAFLTLASSCIFLVLALWKKLNVAGKIGLVMLMISATGMIIAAIFKTDALNTAPELLTKSGQLHQLGAMLDQIPFATIFITIALFKSKRYAINKPLLISGLLIVWFGFVFFIWSIKTHFPDDGIFGPGVPVGWQNRLMIVTQAGWLAMIAGSIVHGDRTSEDG